MKDKERAKGCWIWAGVAFIIFGLPAFMAWNFLLAPMMEFNLNFKNIVGEPEAKLVAELGPPTYKMSKKEVEGQGIDAPWRKMGFLPLPERKVTNEVLLYRHLDHAVYVFIDPKGNVEAVDFAGAQ